MLLEAVVAAGLLGVVAMVAVSMLEADVEREAVFRSRDDLARAEDAVFGYALTQSRFPAPVDAQAVPGHPGVVEGGFPVEATGLAALGADRIRYRVDASLTQAPAARYESDPLGLAGGLVAPDPASHRLDLCVALLAKARALVPGAGESAAFALREPAPGPAAANPAAPLAENAPAPSARQRLRGFGEAAARLDCPEHLTREAAAVKATVAAVDLARLAAQDVELRTLGVTRAGQSMDNLEWQRANLAASLTRYTLDAMQNIVQLKSSPVALIKGGATLAAIAAAMAATGIALGQNQRSRDAARSSIGKAQAALGDALNHERTARSRVREAAGRAGLTGDGR